MTEFPALTRAKNLPETASDEIPAITEFHELNQVCSLNELVERHVSFEKASFHTPGHKGRALSDSRYDLEGSAWQRDVTELPGLDDLSEPDGVLAHLEQRAARLWGARKSLISVGGASAGLTAVMLYLAGKGQYILVPRNAHRSVVHGLVLSGLEPIWYEPMWDTRWGFFGPVTALSINQLLDTVKNGKAAERGVAEAEATIVAGADLMRHHAERSVYTAEEARDEADGAAIAKNKDIAAMVVVSPTYSGAISDIEAIAAELSSSDILLVVDEAHGAHLVPGSGMPDSAIISGADLVVHSLHKTLSGLTQTGLIHIANSNKKIDVEHLRSCLRSLQTSSPSYLLLASIEQAISLIERQEGRDRISRMKLFRELILDQIGRLEGFDVLNSSSSDDPAHIVIGPANGDARKCYELLAQRGIFPEAVLGAGLLFLLGIGSEMEDVQELIAGMKEVHDAIEHELIDCALNNGNKSFSKISEIEQVSSPRLAFFMPSQLVPIESAVGKISAECIAPCPPGIPILVPGQRIPPDITEFNAVRNVRIVLDK